MLDSLVSKKEWYGDSQVGSGCNLGDYVSNAAEVAEEFSFLRSG